MRTLLHPHRKALRLLPFLVGICSALSLRAEQPRVLWATSVIDFSTEYGSPSYGAVQALGEPNVFPGHADDARAWASASRDGQREFLELGYDDGIQAAGVAIFETYNPGAVDRVKVRHATTGEWVEVWSGVAAPQPREGRVHTISFPRTTFPVNGVRIELDSPAVSGWNEIDALALLGSDPATAGPVIGSFTSDADGEEPLYSEIGEEQVSGRVELTDHVHGVAAAWFQVINAAGTAVGQPVAASPLNTFNPIHYRKEWSGTVVIPAGSPPGVYGVRIRALSNGGGESVVAQAGLFTVSDRLPRPDGNYGLTKVIEVGDVGHSFEGRTYVVTSLGSVSPRGFDAPLINQGGDIAFSARLKDQNNKTALTTYLQSGTTRKVLTDNRITGFTGTAGALNDVGWVSFRGSKADVSLSYEVYKSNGDETLLIDDAPTIDGSRPTLNNHGVVVYRRKVPDTLNWELWTGNGLSRQKVFTNTDVVGGTFRPGDGPLYGVVTGPPPAFTMQHSTGSPRIDDLGRAYFRAAMWVADESIATIARVRAGELPDYLITTGDDRLYNAFHSHFAISLNGRVATGVYRNGMTGNFAIPPGGWDWIDTGPATYLIGAGHRYTRIAGFLAGALEGTVSVNRSGRLAYLEFVWPHWVLRSSLSPRQSILRPNHFLNGRRVKSVDISWQAISARDEIACLVLFTDGHQAIYRASPLKSGGADFSLPPDTTSLAAPGGLLNYTLDNVPTGSWVELPPRGTVTITAASAGTRIIQLLGISDHLSQPAEVVVNGVAVGTLAPGEPFHLVAATGASASSVTLRGLIVSAARPQPLAVRLSLSQPTVERLQLHGAGLPLLIQPSSRTHRADELLTLTSGAVDPEGFTFQWSRDGTGPLVNDERTAGAASETLQILPYRAEDAGVYSLVGTGSEGTMTVSARVFNAVPFDQWVRNFFPGQPAGSALTRPDATSLNDGVPNLMKYALGIDPTRAMTAADHRRLSEVHHVVSGEETRIQLRLVLDPSAVDVGLSVESSPDTAPAAWAVLDAEEFSVQETLTAAGRELTVLLPAVDGPARLYRLRLVHAPRR
jgi:hypothetical protein